MLDIAGRLARLESYAEQLGALAQELEVAQPCCAEEHGILENALVEYQSVVILIRAPGRYSEGDGYNPRRAQTRL